MTVRVLLPVVLETEELRTMRMLNQVPDKFSTIDYIFYNIDVIEPHDEFTNFCYVYSGGQRFEVAKSMAEVDNIIMDDIAPPIVPN